jgi:methionyl-tRNA synthetase
MAIGEALPKHVFAHGFLMVRNEETGKGEKMSKSRGNAIAPADVIDLLGVEGYRYFFMTDTTPGEDGAISYSRMEQVYNADLANSWGNLCSRALNMSVKYFDGKTPGLADGWAERDGALKQVASGIADRYCEAMDAFNYVAAKDAVMELVHAANHYIEDSAPWAVAKDPARAGELAEIICDLLESIRICAHLFAPFMPETSAEVLRRMSASDEVGCDDLKAACAWGGLKGGVDVTKGDALFPRLQPKK